MCSPEPEEQPTYEQLAALCEWLAERCERLEATVAAYDGVYRND